MPQLPALEQLRRWLASGAELTYADLTTRLGLSERQVARLLGQLRAEGLPLVQQRRGKHKVFGLAPEGQQVQMQPLHLANDEFRALVIAAKASRAALVGTPHAVPLQRAFDQLLTEAESYFFALEEPRQDWHFDDNPAAAVALDSFRLLEQAMDERQTVRFDYYTASTGQPSHGRRLNPYAFIKRQRSWQLVGYCHVRQRVQHFAMTRVRQVQPCPGEYFEPAAGFNPELYFRDALGALASGQVYELRLLVEPGPALYFRERKYHPTQQEAERPQGRLEVSFELEGLDEMRSFCQSWGTGITVLAPAELRERLRQEAEELAARYRAPAP